jgi:ABC-type lipoprotein release transport system permease subunit
MAGRRFRFSWRTLTEVRGEVDEARRFHLEMRNPTDAGTIAGAVLLLAAVVVLAGLLPSSRAARVDPIRALRAD